MTATRESFAVTVGQVTREFRLVRPTPNSRLPLIEMLGDTEFTRATALEVQKVLPAGVEFLFTCETSSIPLVHTLAELTGLPYEVARKRRRPYMDDPLIQEVASMTLGVGETLWLAASRAALMRGKRVAIVLDVVASGGTLNALERLVVRAGGTVCCRAAAFSQGAPRVAVQVVQELPVFDVK